MPQALERMRVWIPRAHKKKTQADVSATYKPSTQETDKRSRRKLARSPARIGGFQVMTEILWCVVEEDP